MEPLLEVENLRVYYRLRRGLVRAVDGARLSIRPGEAVGLVGESGCGKTTLARAILGVLPRHCAVEGSIRYGGKDLRSLPPEELRRIRGEEIALIFQDPMTRLDPLMTIEAHFVELITQHGRGSKEEARDMAEEALASLGIPPTRLGLYPHEFSGGMRQRIMIAMALVLGPKLLIADEPTTSLDVIVEGQILQILEALRRDHGLALLLVTHNLGIVAEVCDRVDVMYAGEIVEEAPVDAIFSRPFHPYTQGLMSSIIHMETSQLSSIPGQPPDLLHPPSGCRFHPRCPRAFAPCPVSEPRLAPQGDGREVACFLYEGS
jgi:oligopeptide/dipeptide ABC transporter ATP-binding protein